MSRNAEVVPEVVCNNDEVDLEVDLDLLYIYAGDATSFLNFFSSVLISALLWLTHPSHRFINFKKYPAFHYCLQRIE